MGLNLDRAYANWKGWRWKVMGKPGPPVTLPPLVQAKTPNFSDRHSTKISLVVIHDTEGGYTGAVSWLRNPSAQASAHIVLREDGGEATQLVRFADKAWACVDFNARSLNLEMAGTVKAGFSRQELAAAAAITAYWCKTFHIPAHYSPRGLLPGIAFHQDLGAAGGGHSDPGFNLRQKRAFLRQVRQMLDRGLEPSPWGQ